MTSDILLVLATITDTFLAALSYGSGKIKIPFLSAFILSVISSAVLTLSVAVSHTAGEFIPQHLCTLISCTLLAAIGGVQLFQKGLKSLLKKHRGHGKMSFHFLDIDFVISVYIDETKADADCSKLLSAKESLALAAALSVDSVSSGLGAGLSDTNILFVSILSLTLGLISVYAGSLIGRHIGGKDRDLSWVSGVFLILMALVKAVG